VDSGGSEKVKHALDAGVGAMIGDFETAVRALRVWAVMEPAVGERSTQTFVEERV